MFGGGVRTAEHHASGRLHEWVKIQLRVCDAIAIGYTVLMCISRFKQGNPRK